MGKPATAVREAFAQREIFKRTILEEALEKALATSERLEAKLLRCSELVKNLKIAISTGEEV